MSITVKQSHRKREILLVTYNNDPNKRIPVKIHNAMSSAADITTFLCSASCSSVTHSLSAQLPGMYNFAGQKLQDYIQDWKGSNVREELVLRRVLRCDSSENMYK